VRFFLRRRDQVTVAVLLLIALASMVGWWLARGGLTGRLIEIDHVPPLEADFQVDINQADWPEFTLLPGIGETLARRIVRFRRTEGPFRSHEDLQRVNGIGPKTLERIRPYLRPVEPPPPAR